MPRLNIDLTNKIHMKAKLNALHYEKGIIEYINNIIENQVEKDNKKINSRGGKQ
jgi:hypothetical protein